MRINGHTIKPGQVWRLRDRSTDIITGLGEASDNYPVHGYRWAWAANGQARGVDAPPSQVDLIEPVGVTT